VHTIVNLLEPDEQVLELPFQHAKGIFITKIARREAVPLWGTGSRSRGNT